MCAKLQVIISIFRRIMGEAIRFFFYFLITNTENFQKIGSTCNILKPFFGDCETKEVFILRSCYLVRQFDYLNQELREIHVFLFKKAKTNLTR